MYEISLKDVTFAYDHQPILHAVNFTAHAGEFVCLLGPSGCGKSSLLRLVAGLTPATAGDIQLDGRPVSGPGLDRGVVFQDYSLFPWLTAGENIVLALRQAFPERDKGDISQLAADYLEMVGLGDSFSKLPRQLSGGMRQRAAIARAFAINSPVLLMDEPFGALDAITRARLQDLLLLLWQQGESARKTILFVTHDVEEALLLASRIIVLGLNPGTVRLNLEVDLPRPRTRRQLYAAPRFVELRDRLIGELHQNIITGLDAGVTVESAGDAI